MNWKLGLFIGLALVLAGFAVAVELRDPVIRLDACAAQLDPAITSDPSEYQPHCDAFTHTGAFLVLLVPLGLLAEWGGIYGLAWSFTRLDFETPESVKAIVEHRQMSPTARRALWLVAAGCLVLSVAPMVNAAPDTAPSADWDITLAAGGGACANFKKILGMTTDTAGLPYTVEVCETVTPERYVVVTKTSAAGTKLWEKDFHCSVGFCTPYGIAATSDGFVAMAYYDEGSSLAEKTTVDVMRQGNGTIVCTLGGQGIVWPEGFTSDIGEPTATGGIGAAFAGYNLGNNTTAYAIGGPSGVLAMSHSSVAGCRQLWTSAIRGTDSVVYNHFTGYVAAVNRNPSAQLFTLNGTTGATVGSNGIGGFTFSSRSPPNSTGLRLWGGVSAATISFYEFNSTSASTIRTVAPTEASVVNAQSSDDFTVEGSGFFMDGADSIFACGYYYNDVLAQTRPAIAKFNSTASPGQRWNITLGDTSSTGQSHAQTCEVAPGGALYVGYWKDISTDETHLVKYANAGLAPTRDSEYTLTDDTGSASATLTAPDLGSGVAAFAGGLVGTSEGSLFFFGLILVVIAMAGAGMGLRAISKDDDRLSVAGASIVGFGTMIFNVKSTIWPLWTAVVLIVLCGAVATYWIRTKFAGGS